MDSSNREQLAMFSDYGDWARHYSNIRTTIGAVAIALSTLIVTQKDGREAFPLVVSSAIMVAANVLIAYFTYLVRKLQNKQRRLRNEFRNEAVPMRNSIPWDDVPLASMICFSILWLTLSAVL